MKRLLDKSMQFVETIAAALVVVSVALIALQIIFRYVIGHPLNWTEQTARYIFIWVCMLGVPLAVYKGATFQFDLVIKRFSPRVQAIIATVIDVVNMFFSAYWFYWTIRLIEKAGWRPTIGVEVPMGVLYAAQTVCALLMFVVLGVNAVEHAKGIVVKGGAR